VVKEGQNQHFHWATKPPPTSQKKKNRPLLAATRLDMHRTGLGGGSGETLPSFQRHHGYVVFGLRKRGAVENHWAAQEKSRWGESQQPGVARGRGGKKEITLKRPTSAATSGRAGDLPRSPRVRPKTELTRAKATTKAFNEPPLSKSLTTAHGAKKANCESSQETSPGREENQGLKKDPPVQEGERKIVNG